MVSKPSGSSRRAHNWNLKFVWLFSSLQEKEKKRGHNLSHWHFGWWRMVDEAVVRAQISGLGCVGRHTVTYQGNHSGNFLVLTLGPVFKVFSYLFSHEMHVISIVYKLGHWPTSDHNISDKVNDMHGDAHFSEKDILVPDAQLPVTHFPFYPFSLLKTAPVLILNHTFTVSQWIRISPCKSP